MKTIGEISKKTNMPQSTWRQSGRVYEGRLHQMRGRRLLVGMLPGDLIAVRPKGMGKGRTEYIPLAQLYEYLVYSRLRSMMAQQINAKKRRKS